MVPGVVVPTIMLLMIISACSTMPFFSCTKHGHGPIGEVYMKVASQLLPRKRTNDNGTSTIFEDVFPIKKVIFHCHVSLQGGIYANENIFPDTDNVEFLQLCLCFIDCQRIELSLLLAKMEQDQDSGQDWAEQSRIIPRPKLPPLKISIGLNKFLSLGPLPESYFFILDLMKLIGKKVPNIFPK